MNRLCWACLGAATVMGAGFAVITVLAWLAEREDEALYRAERLDPLRPPRSAPWAQYGRSQRGYG